MECHQGFERCSGVLFTLPEIMVQRKMGPIVNEMVVLEGPILHWTMNVGGRAMMMESGWNYSDGLFTHDWTYLDVSKEVLLLPTVIVSHH